MDPRTTARKPFFLTMLRAVLVVGMAIQTLVAHGCHGDDVDHELFTSARVIAASANDP